MNLYIFNESTRASAYGIGTYVMELASSLKNSDMNICMVNLTSDKPQIQTKRIDGIKQWYLPIPIEKRTTDNQKQYELYYRNVIYLLKLHIKDKKDLIFHFNYHTSRTFVEELKKTFDCRIVSVVHFFNWVFSVFDNLPRLRSILYEEFSRSINTRVIKTFEEEKSFYQRVDHIICLSKYMQEILCRDYGLDSAKISVIPNGILDAADLNNNKSFLQKKWNISPREKIILFAGRIDEGKGVNYLIKAFREVLKKEPNCRLILAGNSNNYSQLNETKDICTKISLTGLLEKKDLCELYQIADVGVVPSLFESFGLVAVEMMMHELPLIVTATSGLNEVVDESCGLKVPITVLPDSVEIDTSILASKIVYLLQNPLEAKLLGQNGRKRYLYKYSSKVFGTNMLNMYKSLFHGTERTAIGVTQIEPNDFTMAKNDDLRKK